MSCGLSHVLLLGADSGCVWSSGSNELGQCGVGAGVDCSVPQRVLVDGPCVAVACGWYHSAVVAPRRQLFMFGSNVYGQCGAATPPVLQPDTPLTIPLPTRLTNWDGCDPDPSMGSVEGVACGGWHTLACTTTGDVYSWGSGAHGQTGHATSAATLTVDAAWAAEACSGDAVTDPRHLQGVCTESEPYPRLLNADWGGRESGGGGSGSGASPPRVVGVACGGKHSAAITSRGHVFVWGHACLPVGIPRSVAQPKSQSPSAAAKVPPAAAAASTEPHLHCWGLQRFTLQPTRVPCEELCRGVGASVIVSYELDGQTGGIVIRPSGADESTAAGRATQLCCGRSHTVIYLVC